MAGAIGATFGERSLDSAVHADLEILPHQLEPALALTSGVRRVLVADDVGLGKTIQAGLVIAEVLRRRPTSRVLIIVPAALADQWEGELSRRFGIACLHGDRLALEAGGHEVAVGDNPWRRSGAWLSSLDFLKQPHVVDALPPTPWDLVVFDEAHLGCGDSQRHAVCQKVAANSRQLVLLTATPHDGNEERFNRLLSLGALTAVADPITIFRRSRHTLGGGWNRRVRWRRVQISREEARALDALTDFERAVLRVAGDERRDAALLLLSIFRKRALSTMEALAASLRRRLAWLERSAEAPGSEPHQPSLAFEHADELGPEEAAGLSADVGLDGRHERAWIQRVIVLADAARRHETKVARVVAFVRRIREPIVLFTEFRDSLDVLRRRLHGLAPASLVHGGQSPSERRAELGRFLGGATRVLLATDVAGLGLNLQSRSRAVVNLDLPWNPARLEQRAGRVDRIGQTRPVHVTLFVAAHSAESSVLIRLSKRALVASRSLGEDLGFARAFDEPALRASIFLGAEPDVSRPMGPRWSPSVRWIRPARRAAAIVLRHRFLRRRWRASVADLTSARWTPIDRLVGFRTLARASLLIFSVPLVDGAGTMVERHVVGLCVRRSISGSDALRALAPAATHEATRAFVARAHRLTRRRRAGAVLAIDRERSLGERLAAEWDPVEVQPGLFDRRAQRSREQRLAIVGEIQREVERRIAEIALATGVEVGEPALVAALVDRS